MLKNKNAFVGGGSDGIGKATAIALAKSGANVTVVARNEVKLKQVLLELDTAQGQRHQFLVADYHDIENFQNVLGDFLEQIETVHILVNNSGGPPGGKIFDAQQNEFNNAFTQHLQCNHLLTQTFVPGMKVAKYGRIINVISTSVKQPLDNLGVSNTIRGAVANWGKTMANELGQFGITVNNVLPGATATGRLTEIIESKSKKSGKPPEEISDAMLSQIPARRFGLPSEIAAAIAFLASPDAAYINGINMPVDGGRTKSL